MQTLRKIVSKISHDTIFQQIVEQKVSSPQHYSEALQQFSLLTAQKKQQTLSDILQTFKRQRSTRAVMSALLLIDFLHSLQPELTLFQNCREPKLSRQGSLGKKVLLHGDKVYIAEEQFIRFYFAFLKLNGKKVGRDISFLSCTIEEWIEFCEISIEQILELIKIDFVLTFLVKNCNHITVLKMSLESILQKISFDLRFINKFLEKYLKLIKQKHEHSFRINAIYQKTLFINSNLSKFNAIARNLTKKIDFQRYEIDKELNKSIQMDLYQREQERKNYINSRKRIDTIFQVKNTDNDENIEKFSIEGETMIRLNDFI